jgi:hemerythrin superfamily protein
MSFDVATVGIQFALFDVINRKFFGGKMDALELLKQDHQHVKELFQQADGTQDSNERKQLFNQIETELEIHAHIEETVFYPALEEREELKDMVAEAREEHQEVKALLEEMEDLPSDNDEFDSKLQELQETVEHHVEEEEGEMFPKVRGLFQQGDLERLCSQLESAKGKQHRQAS